MNSSDQSRHKQDSSLKCSCHRRADRTHCIGQSSYAAAIRVQSHDPLAELSLVHDLARSGPPRSAQFDWHLIGRLTRRASRGYA